MTNQDRGESFNPIEFPVRGTQVECASGLHKRARLYALLIFMKF